MSKLLKNQAEAYRSSFHSKFADVQEEIKSMKKDISDLQCSLHFTQRKFDDIQKKVNEIELTINRQQENHCALIGHADEAEGQSEYLENPSRHSNIRMVGLQEDKYEKS